MTLQLIAPPPWRMQPRRHPITGVMQYYVEDEVLQWCVAVFDDEATARLVAAAPDMLDALKAADGINGTGERHAVIANAIKKATGGDSA